MLLQYRPDLSVELAHIRLSEHYRLKGRLSLLPSDRDRNFLLRCENGARMVLKFTNCKDDYNSIRHQSEMLNGLH